MDGWGSLSHRVILHTHTQIRWVADRPLPLRKRAEGEEEEVFQFGGGRNFSCFLPVFAPRIEGPMMHSALLTPFLNGKDVNPAGELVAAGDVNHGNHNMRLDTLSRPVAVPSSAQVKFQEPFPSSTKTPNSRSRRSSTRERKREKERREEGV